MAFWDKITSEGNVEDRRSFSPLAGGVGGLGLVGTLIYLGLAYFLSGGDVGSVLNELQKANLPASSFQQSDYQYSQEYPKFASRVLGSTNDYWSQVFSQSGRSYEPPRLVLFRVGTQSGCGGADSRYGPHYCPADSTIYLDETFFDELQSRFKAQGGDVAEAYVIAHEVGHHVQNQLGMEESSVAVELQADCFAGVWAHAISAQGVLEPNEINEALDAAASVGDDRIQQNTTGRINPETWTHGSAAQRTEWFNRGYQSGEPSACNPA